MREIGETKVLTLAIREQKAFKGFPVDARLMIKLIENKQMELVDFGTLENPKAAVDLKNQGYLDPGCQLRVANANGERIGILFGSTQQWRLNSENPVKEGGVRGLLNFLPAKIAPRAWKLCIEENAHPVIQIDNRIPNPKVWAKNDPTFVNTIMPAVIYQLFDDILEHENPEETEWMKDWLTWADNLMPGNQKPQQATARERREWIDGLIDSFCSRHMLSDRLVDVLVKVGGDA
ncbi:hypothetical protein [Rhizobium sp. LjRoot254]|uniref:hypothetical protein n=1 Tax=Rhizobium sp. LjRoot254 TaxID=3342297 RepID=UPI003ECE5606